MKIKFNGHELEIPEGKPVRVCWKSKNKDRPGISWGIGWLRKGDAKGQIKLVHSAFQTYDQAEQEYPASWNIYIGNIIDIREMKLAACPN